VGKESRGWMFFAHALEALEWCEVIAVVKDSSSVVGNTKYLIS
jgi:hypothetical protein